MMPPSSVAGGRHLCLMGSLDPAFTGRARKRIIAAGLGFPNVLRFFVGIATTTPRIIADDLVG
jgi:hypothetical protein